MKLFGGLTRVQLSKLTDSIYLKKNRNFKWRTESSVKQARDYRMLLFKYLPVYVDSCGKSSTPWGKNLIEILSSLTGDKGINSMNSF